LGTGCSQEGLHKRITAGEIVTISFNKNKCDAEEEAQTADQINETANDYEQLSDVEKSFLVPDQSCTNEEEQKTNSSSQLSFAGSMDWLQHPQEFTTDSSEDSASKMNLTKLGSIFTEEERKMMRELRNAINEDIANDEINELFDVEMDFGDITIADTNEEAPADENANPNNNDYLEEEEEEELDGILHFKGSTKWLEASYQSDQVSGENEESVTELGIVTADSHGQEESQSDFSLVASSPIRSCDGRLVRARTPFPLDISEVAPRRTVSAPRDPPPPPPEDNDLKIAESKLSELLAEMKEKEPMTMTDAKEQAL